MREPIQNINNDFWDGNIPDKSDFSDPFDNYFDEDDETEYWVRGQKRIECGICYGIGCEYCSNLGYTTKKI